MEDFATELAELEALSLRRTLRWVQGPQGRHVEIGSKILLNFASNDYLGLANHPELKSAMQDAVDRWGVGSGASRLITGSMSAHGLLEAKICELKETEAALSFATGYASSVGTVSALMGKGDTIILDKLSHASLIDGARLSGATLRVFPHNGLEKLERLLKNSRDAGGRVMVITESVFSMDGDLASLAEIVELKDKYGALLLLDEAHGLGIYGENGMGLSDHLDLSDKIDIHMGTLGKAAGVAGGYIAGNRDMIDLVVNKGRSFIYSTAPPPAQSFTAMKAMEMIASSEGRQRKDRLWANIEYLSKRLGIQGTSAILPWQVGCSEMALELMEKLQIAGFFVPAIRYPTVPRDTARLRITLTSEHQKADLDALVAELIF